MQTIIQKILALPTLLPHKYSEIQTKYRKNRTLCIRPVRDVGDQLFSRDFERESIDSDNIFQKIVGIYKVDNVFLHRPSGLSLVQEDPDAWPIGIVESGAEDFQALSLRRNQYRNANKIDIKRTPVVRYQGLSYIFNALHRKNNYYHFVIDSLSRLVTLLELIDEPVNVLHFCERQGHVGQYFDLVEDYYNCRFHKIESIGSRHLRIESTVLFPQDTYRKLAHSIPHVTSTKKRLAIDPQLKFLNIRLEQLTPIYKDQKLLAKSWRENHTKEIYKNNTGHYDYSHLQMKALYLFGKKIVKSDSSESNAQGVRLYVVRGKATSRSRYIGNESELIDRTGLTAIDYSELSVAQQIQVTNNCQVLVGLTGAGLTNCVYMEPGGCLVEVTPIGYSLPATNLFENICNARGLGYERIFSTQLDENGLTVVDIDELCEVLKGR